VAKGVGRKISSGGGEQRKKDRKIALLSLFQGEGNGKKDQKIALLSFLLLYLYHGRKSGGGHGPCCRRHARGNLLTKLTVFFVFIKKNLA